MLPTANIYNLNQITEKDKLEAGSISTDLVHLADYGLAIPNSFIFTSNSTKKYFEELKISEMWDKFVNTTKIDSISDFNKFSSIVQRKIQEGEFSGEVNKQLERFYLALSGFSDSYTQIRMAEVAVNRVENPRGFDYKSYSNVKGIKNVIKSIKDVLASSFEPVYLYYLMSKNISPIALNYPVIIQKMVQPEISGNLFTINSYDDNPKEILIEAILGLYEPIQSGDISPDHYIVDKETEKIVQKYIVPQEWMLIRKGNAKGMEESNFKVNISKTWQHKQKLEDKYIHQLLKLSGTIEKAFNKKPMQVVWFYESGRIWVYSVSELPKLELPEDSKIAYEVKESSTLNEIKKRLGVTGDIKIFKNSENIKLAEVYGEEDKVEEKLIEKKEPVKIKEEISFNGNGYELLLTGNSGVNGTVIGKTKLVSEETDLTELTKNDIAVLESISSKYVSLLKNAGGIVLDESGTVNDVVLLAKDYLIPCIVGTTIASKILKQGENIGLDGTNGKVYEIKEHKEEKQNTEVKKVEEKKTEKTKEVKKEEIIYVEPKKELPKEVKIEPKRLLESEFEKTFIEGLTSKQIEKVKEIAKVEEKKVEKDLEKVSKPKIQYPYVVTATKIMLSLQDPSSVTVEDVLYTDGVGLFRSELLLTKFGDSINEVLGNKALKTKLEGNIYESLLKVSGSFNPKPVIYRLADFKSNEVDSKNNRNPLIGNRGAYSLLNTEGLLDVELEAIRKVRNVDGFKNVWVNIPYGRTIDEIVELKKRILEYGFKRSSSFKIYVSIETPSMAYSIDKLLDIGIDGLILDTNDLIQLLLGSSNSFDGNSSYSIESSGIFELIDTITDKSSKANVPIIITGNLIGDDMNESRIKTLIESGVTGLSVSKDRINDIKQTVARLESSILLNKRTPHRKAKLTFPKRKK